MKRCLSLLTALALLIAPLFKIQAAYSTTKTYTFDGITPEQLCEVELPDAQKILSLTITDGNGNTVPVPAYTFENDKLSAMLSGGASHATVNNPQKYSQEVTIEKTQTAAEGDYFPSVTQHTDGEFSGELQKVGSAYFISGSYLPEQSRWVEDISERPDSDFPMNKQYAVDGYEGILNKTGSMHSQPAPPIQKEITYNAGRMYTKAYNVAKLELSRYLARNSENNIITKVTVKIVPSTTATEGFFRFKSVPIPTVLYQMIESGSRKDDVDWKYQGTNSDGVYENPVVVDNEFFSYIEHPQPSFLSYINYLDEDGFSGTLQLKSLPRVAFTNKDAHQLVLRIATAGADKQYKSPSGYTALGAISKFAGRFLYGSSIWYSSVDFADDTTFTFQTKSISEISDYMNSQTVELLYYQVTPQSPFKLDNKDTVIQPPISNVNAFNNPVIYFEDDVIFTGTVAKESGEVVFTQKYSGLTVKPSIDTRIWGQRYTGTIYKSGMENLYQYHIEVKYLNKSTGGSSPINVPITVLDNSVIEATIYGLPGAVRDGKYSAYSALAHMPEAVAAGKTTGIAIKLEVSSGSADKYLAGTAQLGSKQYPVHWGSFAGEKIIPAADAVGYVYIDKSDFTSNLKNAKLKIAVGEYSDAAARTKTNEGSSTLYVTVDVSPPAIAPSYSRLRSAVTIDTFDSVSGVKNVLYSVDGGTFKAYTSELAVPSGSSYVDIVAVDMVENSSAYRLALTGDNTVADTVTGADIYTYKTKKSIVYIINGNKSNTDNVSLADLKIG